LPAFGVVMYEAVAGELPFARSGQFAGGDPDFHVASLRPELDAPFASMIMRCLQRDPLLRCSSADDVRQALRAARVDAVNERTQPVQHRTDDTVVALAPLARRRGRVHRTARRLAWDAARAAVLVGVATAAAVALDAAATSGGPPPAHHRAAGSTRTTVAGQTSQATTTVHSVAPRAGGDVGQLVGGWSHGQGDGHQRGGWQSKHDQGGGNGQGDGSGD
jgi:hypothetical protein